MSGAGGGRSDARAGPQPQPVVERAPASLALQRKCACGGDGASTLTGACNECEQKKLQRRAVAPSPHGIPDSVGDVLGTAGTPLDPVARREMESHFGHDFGNVRIHTDAHAAESARNVGALAYTVGSHVVFGAGQYAPTTHAGRHLLAHELTHTVQQRSGLGLQRQHTAVSAPADASEVEADRTADAVASGFLVEDDAQTGSGQMRKTEFLDELQRSSCAAADAELARVGRSTEGCPFVERAFSRYRTMPAARVEQAIRRYVDPAGVTGARDYIPLVTRRVAEGVARWATTGDMSGVPAELAGEAMGGGGGILGMLAGGLAGLAGGIGRLLFKRDGGGDATAAEAAMVSSSLGGGAPLESGVRGRMESAFGHDFSHVRVHSGSTGASMSSSLGARAFTVGGDVAFAAGEYRPNTLIGDALIAHELAHVVQQSSGGGTSAAVEEDADHSAVSAMLAVWTGAKHITRSAMPRLRSGLGLQRCGGTPARPTTPPTGARMTCTAVDPAQWSTAVTAAQGLTDMTAKAAAMTTLAQQALCELNIQVVQAGTSSTTTVEVADYQPNPVMNFDVHLNSKPARAGGRSLRENAGYSFQTGGALYSALGPLALNPATPLTTRQFAEHELGIAEGLGRGETGVNSELRVWVTDFRRYFHQYLTLPIDERPSWSQISQYYDRATDGKAEAIESMVDYYNNPPAGIDRATLQTEFAYWMRRQRRRQSQFLTDLNAELHLVTE